MYQYKKYFKYCKTLLYSNFLNMNFKWWFTKHNKFFKNTFNKIIILLKLKPKQYNKKIFIISLMLLEFILKQPFFNNWICRNAVIFSNSKIKKFLSITYILSKRNIIFFINFFFSNIYWMIYEKILNFNKNKIELNFNNQINYTFKIYKLLDFQTFIKNKLQFESYF